MVVGLVTSASGVLDAIAADMVDGVVDARGETGTSARIVACNLAVNRAAPSPLPATSPSRMPCRKPSSSM